MQAYENLNYKGFLKPLDPTPMPNLVPRTWNLNEYCNFHPKSGYKTNNCFHLNWSIGNNCGISCNGHHSQLQPSLREGMTSSHWSYSFCFTPKDEDPMEMRDRCGA